MILQPYVLAELGNGVILMVVLDTLWKVGIVDRVELVEGIIRGVNDDDVDGNNNNVDVDGVDDDDDAVVTKYKCTAAALLSTYYSNTIIHSSNLTKATYLVYIIDKLLHVYE